jgi:hypothetical protein
VSAYKSLRNTKTSATITKNLWRQNNWTLNQTGEIDYASSIMYAAPSNNLADSCYPLPRLVGLREGEESNLPCGGDTFTKVLDWALASNYCLTNRVNDLRPIITENTVDSSSHPKIE